jgi:beta-carotene ketolase (CrtW type)
LIDKNERLFGMKVTLGNKGLFMASAVILVWMLSMILVIKYATDISNPLNWIWVLWLTHLYTGLFITAHDTFHGTVSDKKKLNYWVGVICITLYAAFSYKKVKAEHRKHHQSVATSNDPDYYEGGFFSWYWHFLMHYISIVQLIILALVFNVIHYLTGVPKANLVLFWILPPILSTIQLFYFGTYQPHKNPETIENIHKTRSQKKNHLWGFISCYFFGYHLEHHKKPFLPWWKLWTEK